MYVDCDGTFILINLLCIQSDRYTTVYFLYNYTVDNLQFNFPGWSVRDTC